MRLKASFLMLVLLLGPVAFAETRLHDLVAAIERYQRRRAPSARGAADRDERSGGTLASVAPVDAEFISLRHQLAALLGQAPPSVEVTGLQGGAIAMAQEKQRTDFAAIVVWANRRFDFRIGLPSTSPASTPDPGTSVAAADLSIERIVALAHQAAIAQAKDVRR
jgi:hypothetical protein